MTAESPPPTAPAAAAAIAPKRSFSMPTIVWPIAALLVILLLNAGTFFHVDIVGGNLHGSLIDVLRNGSKTMLVALGMTLVIATGGIDLSVGAVVAIAATVFAMLVGQHQWNIPAAAAVAVGVGAIAGAWNGFLVAVLRIQPLVATLVLMVAGRGIAQLISEGQIITVADNRFSFIMGGYVLGVPFPVWLVLAALAASALLTRRTAMGLFIESVGGNATAARFAGVNERAVTFAVYLISGCCAGIAGLIEASNIRAADANHAGLYLELDAILAVVVGGTSLAGGRFSLIGSIVGALVVQAITTSILTRAVAVELTLVVKAVVVVAVALLQSEQFRKRLVLRKVRA